MISINSILNTKSNKTQTQKPCAKTTMPHKPTPIQGQPLERDIFVSETKYKGKSPIPPRKILGANYGPKVKDEYDPYEYLDLTPNDVAFSEESGAKILKKVDLKPNQKIIQASNFASPYPGSIAVSSDFDEYLFTSGLYQCAAMSIVDKKQNIQTLLHCFPGQSTNGNKEIIEYILSHSNKEDLEISIVPGCCEETAKTISFLTQTIDELAPEAKVNLCNFQKDTYGVILHNGEIGCCNDLNTNDIIINPRDYIIYSK